MVVKHCFIVLSICIVFNCSHSLSLQNLIGGEIGTYAKNLIGGEIGTEISYKLKNIPTNFKPKRLNNGPLLD